MTSKDEKVELKGENYIAYIFGLQILYDTCAHIYFTSFEVRNVVEIFSIL